MLYGATMFITDFSVRPDELARLLEERGFESLWAPEHTHIPANRRSPWPGGPELPKDYWHTYDPFVALTAAALVTERLKLGTGICLMVQRDPITTAKEVASLDLLSNGRVLFGIGGGWNAEEMEDHGTSFKLRWRVMRERILAMKEIWTQEEAEFHGRYVNFDKLWAYPKPVQQPHPPVIMGGDAPTTFDRVIEYCDGWMPIYGRLRPGPSLPDKIGELRRRAQEAGRDPASISVSVYGARPDAETIEKLAAAGVERAVLPLPSAARDVVEPLLDRYAALLQAAPA
jgi:probable F420-dependent oxidoreductase